MDYYFGGGVDGNSIDLSENYSMTSTCSVAAYDRSSVSSFGDRSSGKVHLSGGRDSSIAGSINIDLDQDCGASQSEGSQVYSQGNIRAPSPGNDLGYHTLLAGRPEGSGQTAPVAYRTNYGNAKPNKTTTLNSNLSPSCYQHAAPRQLDGLAQGGRFSPGISVAWPSSGASLVSPRASPFPRSAITSLPMDPLTIRNNNTQPITSGLTTPVSFGNTITTTDTAISDTDKLLACTYKGKKTYRSSFFDKLPDEITLKIFSFLPSNELCTCARVCRRWYFLAWEPQLWVNINLGSEKIHVDRGLKTLFRLLCRDSPTVCLTVERIALNGCERLSDKGLSTIARRCPELRSLEIRGCGNVTNTGVSEIVTKCLNLERLEVTGCYLLTNISPRPQTIGASCSASDSGPDHSEQGASLANQQQGQQVQPQQPQAQLEQPMGMVSSRRLRIQHLDLTDCHALDDLGLKTAVSICPQLTHLYLRRCVQLTDVGIKAVASYCIMLRELSISDCMQVTDFGMYELAKLGPNLRYLSVAKCDQISDAGIKQIARHCYKLRYLNARGCEAVSDDSMEMLARSCPRLRALDIGKCDVTDQGLKLLSEHCPNLKKLSVKSCDMITDKGIQSIAYYCRGLQQLNIQDCHITIEGYRTVKKFCKRCIIEHTNPGFF